MDKHRCTVHAGRIVRLVQSYLYIIHEHLGFFVVVMIIPDLYI